MAPRSLNQRQTAWLYGGVGLACFTLLMTLEVLSEEGDFSFLDLLVDGLTILLTIGAAVGVALMTQRLQNQHEEKMALMRDLAHARAEGNEWRGKVQNHLAGLKAGLNMQFDEWDMTPAEREVGLLILKGLSHKEIANLRDTSEATVRQQAQSIYRKANLPGKTAFTAYFLEDLFAPEAPSEDAFSEGPAAGTRLN